jgi:hypothetical protein
MRLERPWFLSTKSNSKKRNSNARSNTKPTKKPTKDFASRVLRKVPIENGFYFYEAEGSATGLVATSLQEFCECVKFLSPEIVEFHLGREDFANWIRFLGDDDLSNRISSLHSENPTGEATRLAFISTLQTRLDELQRSS